MISAKRGTGRTLWKDMMVTAYLLLMRVRQILRGEEPFMPVIKKEQTIAKQRMKLKDKNISGRGTSLCKD